MSKIKTLVSRTKILLSPDHSRIVLRKFFPGPETRIQSIIGRIIALSERDVSHNLRSVVSRFSKRHLNVEEKLLERYESVKIYSDTDFDISDDRKLLIGSYFSNEYSFESAALFNPSIVLHPDQTGLPNDSIRFIMSLRATGEGHISSLTFRTGTIDSSYSIVLDPVSEYANVAPTQPDSAYDKISFKYKLAEMGFENDFTASVLDALDNSFTLNQLKEALTNFVNQNHRYSVNDKLVRDKMLWLALANYGVLVSEQHHLSSWVLFPASPTESNGIEDARFVRFINDDGSYLYYATYTAYDGKVITPQLLETDFKYFKMITLNGNAIQNKGMALFPRKINGKFAMLSRQDGESIFLMYSDNMHFWNDAVRIVKPKYDWEFMQIGNCGSPIETDRGWLVLTHGVGSFRQYSIGAILLDINDPSRIIGRLSEPMLVSSGVLRDGYVPNVVYTCGCLVHKDKLIVPYSYSDLRTTISTVDLPRLLQLLQSGE